jgi:hypothetical protein
MVAAGKTTEPALLRRMNNRIWVNHLCLFLRKARVVNYPGNPVRNRRHRVRRRHRDRRLFLC